MPIAAESDKRITSLQVNFPPHIISKIGLRHQQPNHVTPMVIGNRSFYF